MRRRHGQVGGERVELVAQRVQVAEVDQGRLAGPDDQGGDAVAHHDVRDERGAVRVEAGAELLEAGRLDDDSCSRGQPLVLAHPAAQLVGARVRRSGR